MPTIIRTSLLAILVVVVTPATAPAWSDPGHQIIGAVADIVMQRDHPRAYRAALDLLERKDAGGSALPGTTLSEVSVLADCVRAANVPCGRLRPEEGARYTQRNPRHSAYHFADLSLQWPRYRAGAPAAGDTGVVEMINYAVAQLRSAVGPQPRPAPPPRKPGVELSDVEALWLLVHLVGDVHQPLHVATKYVAKDCQAGADPTSGSVESSLGGNRVRLVAGAQTDAASPGPRNLHAFWDTDAVRRAMQASGVSQYATLQDYAEALAEDRRATVALPAGAPETWAAEWASEIMPLAAQAHDLPRTRRSATSASGPCSWEATLDPDYLESAAAVTHAQLAKAGFRLAALLKAIFDP